MRPALLAATLAVLGLLPAVPAGAEPDALDVGCDPDDLAPLGVADIAAALRAACADNVLARAADGGAPAAMPADERLGARFVGSWSKAEKELLAKVLDLLPHPLVDRMRVGELRRTRVATVGDREIPNPAVFTPNGRGVLQVADRTFEREPHRAMVILLHELLHSTQFTVTGRPEHDCEAFIRAATGWRFEIVSTGIFSREYRWSHDGRPLYVGPNYGDGLTPPENAFEEMVAAMVDYVAAPEILRRERPQMYERLRDTYFGGREYRCGG